MEPIRSGDPKHDDFLREYRERYPHYHYAIDPYVEVFQVAENVYAIDVLAPHDVGDNWVYLIIGPERSLLVDNGFGIGDLKGLCEMLSGNEVVTTVTHFHGDHAWGSSQWDWIYAHEFSAEALEREMDKGLEAWWYKMNKCGTPIFRKFYLDRDRIELKKYEIRRLKNGDKIDLGNGYEIELFHMAGHSVDSTAFLDPNSRMLFSGDALFESREWKGLGVGLHTAKPGVSHPEYAGITYYRKRVKDLLERIGEFDTVMSGHGFLASPSSIVEDTKIAIDRIFEDPEQYDDYVDRHTGRKYIKRHGLVDVMYIPEDIRKEIERKE